MGSSFWINSESDDAAAMNSKNELFKYKTEFQPRYIQSVYLKERTTVIQSTSEEATNINENILLLVTEPKDILLDEMESLRQGMGCELRDEPLNRLSTAFSTYSIDCPSTEVDSVMEAGGSIASTQSVFSNRSIVLDNCSFGPVHTSGNANRHFLMSYAKNEKSKDFINVFKNDGNKLPRERH